MSRKILTALVVHGIPLCCAFLGGLCGAALAWLT